MVYVKIYMIQAGSGSASFVGSILAGVILLTGPIAAFGVNRWELTLEKAIRMMSYLFSGLVPA